MPATPSLHLSQAQTPHRPNLLPGLLACWRGRCYIVHQTTDPIDLLLYLRQSRVLTGHAALHGFVVSGHLDVQACSSYERQAIFGKIALQRSGLVSGEEATFRVPQPHDTFYE